jgi:hypothetical protein
MPRQTVTPPHAAPHALSKLALRQLADGLVLEEAFAVERCVEFVLAETRGLWHGRARALMCRRLKHSALTSALSQQLVACISQRLATGVFSEQFKDQLTLALHLDAHHLVNVARSCADSPRAHVRRYAQWVLNPTRLESRLGKSA